MKTIYNKSLFILLLFLCLSCKSENSTSQDQYKREVRIAAHRGDWRNYADNSLEGIESCIRKGIDIVEIDVSMTKDSVLILMHDKTVDRTTNGKGLVSELTYDEIKELKLRNGLGRVSEYYRVPTFRQIMETTKDRILVNVDKADRYFDLVYDVLKETGTVSQTIIKSEKTYSELKGEFGSELSEMIFMPIIVLNEASTKEQLDIVIAEKHSAYEIVFSKADHPLLPYVLESLRRNSSEIWINSLWPSLCGGLSDDLKEDTWRVLVEEYGADILQTDRPMELLQWLQQNGYRK